jgi:hypothetical protein
MELFSALVGAVSALAGVGIGYWLQIRARKKERILDSVFRALALARQYQWDPSAFGMAYVNLGNFPKPLPEDDAEAVKQFALEHGLKGTADAELTTCSVSLTINEYSISTSSLSSSTHAWLGRWWVAMRQT